MLMYHDKQQRERIRLTKNFEMVNYSKVAIMRSP
jgi:hypothetical protein